MTKNTQTTTTTTSVLDIDPEGDGQMSAPTMTEPDETTAPSAVSLANDDPPDDLAHDQPLSTVDDAWWAHARCNDGGGRLARMFFSDELQDIARAKHICATCPAMIPCLEGALERREPWGVWGGQLFVNGRIQTVKRRRGRPPKLPRPEDQLPDVPVPEQLRDQVLARSA